MFGVWKRLEERTEELERRAACLPDLERRIAALRQETYGTPDINRLAQRISACEKTLAQVSEWQASVAAVMSRIEQRLTTMETAKGKRAKR